MLNLLHAHAAHAARARPWPARRAGWPAAVPTAVLTALLVALLVALAPAALAGPAPAGCLRDRLGEPVCAPPFGSIGKDILGEVVCGTGQCRVDHLRRLVCSAQPGGAATLNRLNQVVCVGGCELASAQRCQRPQPLQEVDSAPPPSPPPQPSPQ